MDLLHGRRRGTVAALMLTALLAFAPAATADLVDDNPAAASPGPGRITVSVRAANGALQQSTLGAGGVWGPWTSLGGTLTSGPAASARLPTATDTFARGGGNALFGRSFASGLFSDWIGYGDVMLSAPAATARKGTPYVDVVYRGADNRLVIRSLTPGVGLGLPDQSLGGSILSAPGIVSRGTGLIDIFVRANDDRVYRNAYTGAWTGWQLIDPTLTTTSAPAAATRTEGTMDLFVRDAKTGTVRWRSFDGVRWLPWRPLAGVVESAPAAVSDHPDRIYLFARREGGVIHVNLYDRGLGPDKGWTGWRPLHPPPPQPVAPPPPPACTPEGGTVTFAVDGRAKRRRVSFGRRARLSGQARTVLGAPRAAAAVRVLDAQRGVVLATGQTDGEGRFVVRLPARGPSRSLRIEVASPGDSALACATLRLQVRAGVRFSASGTVARGGRVFFSGRVLGLPVPRRGKLVEVQAFDGGDWRMVVTPRTDRRGRFRAGYKLRRTTRARTFRFRARVRAEAGYPYALGLSRTVTTRVR
jgi:hypothetical protein